MAHPLQAGVREGMRDRTTRRGVPDDKVPEDKVPEDKVPEDKVEERPW
ncbi:MAG: hypothetical protein ACREJE_10990 [Candidatus Rokuibacteriota bacterium]